MTPKKAKVMKIEDDGEDWDDWVEEREEIVDIIDDVEEDDPLEDDEPERARSRRSGNTPRKQKRVRSGMNPRVKKGFVWTVRVCIVILVTLLLFAPGFPFHDIREATGINSLKNLMRPYLPFPEWANVTVTLMYDVSVRYGRSDEITVKFAPPFDIPSIPASGQEKDYLIQDVLDIRYSPATHMETVDYNRSGNSITGWTATNVQNPLHYEVTIDMTLHAYKWDLTEKDSGYIEDIPEEYSRYNVDAWKVSFNDHYRYEPSDPEINSTAHMLTDDEPTVLGKVKAIYDWMEDKFHYTTDEERLRDEQVYHGYPKWATACLTDRYGDCDDQSLLMASLCRAVGIPAWLEIGYLFNPNQRDNTNRWGGHGWFNVLIPLRDSDDYVIANIDPVNHEFLFRDPYRFTDWVDNGQIMMVDNEPMYNLDYYYNYFSHRSPTGVDVKSIPSTRSDRFEKHGSIKVYSDKPLTEGNLPGTQQELESLPAPSPLLLAPLAMILLAVPVRRYFIKRD